MAEKTNKGLVAYGKAQLGLPYWYGTFGQTGTAALYAAKKVQYRDQYPPKKWTEESFASQFGKRVHDCAGLIKGYMFSETPTSAPVYNTKYDLSANGMIEACQERGDISTLPELPGIILWKNNHVGIYAGDGIVYEAKGHAYGVIASKVTSTAWKKWGKLPFIKYEETPAPQPEPTPGATCTPTAPVLRRGDKNASVRRLQAILNTYGFELDIDGSFGPKTEAAVRSMQIAFKITNDGVVGAETWTRLLAA